MRPAEPTEEQLAEFQAALLQLLAEELPAEAMQQRLGEDSAFAPFRSYVQAFEPRMLEVAAALVKKWGRRRQPGSDR